MKKRMILTLLAVVFFAGAVGFVKFRQIQIAMAQGKAYRPPPEAVTTTVARSEQWASTLSSIGSVQAVHGVMVSADLPGIVEKIVFESGRPVRPGDILVLLDTRQEQAQLAAAQAQRDLAALSFQRVDQLTEKGVMSQAEHDQAYADLKRAEAGVGEIEAAIARKTIRAPFLGNLGIRQANLGQYLNAGDPIVPLQSLDPIYVNFSVPQQQVAALRVGGEVTVTVDGPESQQRTGRISAINSLVDEATRNVQIQATFDNPDAAMRPGMFVEVSAVRGPGTSVVTLPASAVSFAPYGDSVFLVEELKDPDGQSYQGVRQQFVKLGGARGDQVAVLTGVAAGQEVVTSGVFKLRNGAAIMVNNEVQPSNDPAPRPEDS